MPITRRKILINPPFQIRFSLYVCLYLVAMSFIYPVIIYNLFEYFFRYLSLDPTGPDVAGLHATRNQILFLLVAVQLSFFMLTFLSSIFISHRIAGPLYKLRMFMARAKVGQFDQKLAFRKSDHFRDLADDYNDMIDGFRKQLGAPNQAIAHIERALVGASPETRRELEGALSALKPHA